MDGQPRGGLLRKLQDVGGRSRQLIRFGRTLVPLLILGLVGCVFGCSGGNSTPEERKAYGDMMKEDMKKAMKEAQAARKANAKGGLQGRGPR
jgi:hypothetical protein